MLNNLNKRIVMGPWPDNRKLAIVLGTLDFFTGVDCVNGHLSTRRTNSGKCYECDRAQWERGRRSKGKKPFTPNAARQAALALSSRYFDGAPCPNGHGGLRWTHNGACVDCTVAASRAFQKTPEGIEASKRWRVENLDKVRESNRNMKARRKGAEGKHTAQDIRDILARQKYKCVECGTSVKSQKNRHVDHIMPIKLGGSNWPSNLQVLCQTCNLTKNAKHPLDWAREKGRLV